jgi:hypothetical protein
MESIDKSTFTSMGKGFKWKGGPVSFVVVAPFLFILSFQLLRVSVTALDDGMYGPLAIAVGMLFLILIGGWYCRLNDEIIVLSTGDIKIKLVFVRGSISWSGTRDDIVTLEYQTHDTGDGTPPASQ